MNKKILSVIGVAVASLTLGSCGGQTPANTDRYIQGYPIEFYINNSGIALNVGESQKIDLLMRPYVVTSYEAIYESKNTDVATVSSDGVVTARGGGIAEIEVKVRTGSGEKDFMKKSLKVYVVESVSYEKMCAEVPYHLAYQDDHPLHSFKARNYSIREHYRNNEMYADSHDNCDYLHYTDMKTPTEEDPLGGEKNGRVGFLGYEIDRNVVNGSSVENKYCWQFHCNEDYTTYVFHDNAQLKKYCSIDTSLYIGQSRLEPCLDLINGMFTNGKVILTQHLTIAAQRSLISYFVDNPSAIQSGTSNWGAYVDEATNTRMFRFQYTERDSGTIEPDDEDYYQVPAGTQYSGSFKLDLLFVNGYTRVNKTYNDMHWNVSGVKGDYIRDDMTHYEIEDEINVPTPDRGEYIKVDEVFDL